MPNSNISPKLRRCFHQQRHKIKTIFRKKIVEYQKMCQISHIWASVGSFFFQSQGGFVTDAQVKLLNMLTELKKNCKHENL